jgi:hypothetical protein
LDEGAGQFLQIEIIQQEIRAWHGKTLHTKKNIYYYDYFGSHTRKKKDLSPACLEIKK